MVSDYFRISKRSDCLVDLGEDGEPTGYLKKKKKSPYYPKQSTDVTQSLSKYQ